MRVSVFGMGYVGCVTAVCLADAGHSVLGVDVASVKVDALNAGESPIVEPGLADLVAAVRSSGKFIATLDQAAAVRNAEVVLVALGTPTLDDGSTDLHFLERACVEIGRVIGQCADKKTVMIRSTVPPGTTETSIVGWLESASGKVHGRGFFVVFCPEFLREVSALEDFANPPFTVIGTADPEHARVAVDLFSFLDAPVHVVDYGTAESVKLASNAFHAVKVAFANELARVFDSAGSDSRRIFDIFREDEVLNVSPKYLRPGFAYGGSCLPKDLRILDAMAHASGVDSPLIGGVAASNTAHVEAAYRKVMSLGIKSVALFGLTFKFGTDDMRESPYLELVKRLLESGVSVKVFDSTVAIDRLTGANRSAALEAVPTLGLLMTASPSEALAEAECVLLGSADESVYGAILDHRNAWVVDLSGNLPPDVENALRARAVESGESSYIGVAW